MSLFTMPKDQITFADVEAFCKERGEGVRVEYKAKIAHIAKTVSAFANSQGGVFIIGVETDDENKAVIPITGIPNDGGLEEAITQSAATGIYPPVMPEVAVVRTEKDDHVVVVVRVDESPHAPHAIQNSTRAYIRTGNVSLPEELADMDRIQYMLKRREDSTIVYGQIIKRMEDRVAKHIDPNQPSITAIARPVFPYKPIISTRKIHDFMRREFTRRDTYRALLSRVSGGVVYYRKWVSPLNRNRLYYRRWEMNDHGIVYGNRSLPIDIRPIEELDMIHHQDIYEILQEFLRCAALFYNTCEYRGIIEVSLRLRNVDGKNLRYAGDTCNQTTGDQLDKYKCRDSEISAHVSFPSDFLVRSDMRVVESIIRRLPIDSTIRISRQFYGMPEILSIFDELIAQILWSFDIDYTPHRE